MSEETYPWPLDPSVLTPDIRDGIRDLVLAALKEVCSEVEVERTSRSWEYRGVGLSHDVFARAVRLALDSLRIPWKAISQREWSERIDAFADAEVPA